MKTITSIEQLKQEADIANNENGWDGFIALNGAKSSKHIWYNPILDAPDSWQVFHYIDEREVTYYSTDEFIEGEPNIVEAIQKNSLISY